MLEHNVWDSPPVPKQDNQKAPQATPDNPTEPLISSQINTPQETLPTIERTTLKLKEDRTRLGGLRLTTKCTLVHFTSNFKLSHGEAHIGRDQLGRRIDLHELAGLLELPIVP